MGFQTCGIPACWLLCQVNSTVSASGLIHRDPQERVMYEWLHVTKPGSFGYYSLNADPLVSQSC
jgi:hypothetical protein